MLSVLAQQVQETKGWRDFQLLHFVNELIQSFQSRGLRWQNLGVACFISLEKQSQQYQVSQVEK